MSLVKNDVTMISLCRICVNRVRFESVETFRRWHCHTQSATDSICRRPAPIGLVSLHFDFPFVRGPSRTRPLTPGRPRVDSLPPLSRCPRALRSARANSPPVDSCRLLSIRPLAHTAPHARPRRAEPPQSRLDPAGGIATCGAFQHFRIAPPNPGVNEKRKVFMRVDERLFYIF